MQFESEIPNKSGIYSWIYWPFTNSVINDFKASMKMLKTYSHKDFKSNELFKGYKFIITASEKWLSDENEGVLGLNSSNTRKLEKYLKDDHNRIQFFSFLKEIAFNRPFYIGKAKGLRSRLIDHFNKRNSEIINLIDQNQIRRNEIFIKLNIVQNENLDEDIERLHEIIIQNYLKPSITKKFG